MATSAGDAVFRDRALRCGRRQELDREISVRVAGNELILHFEAKETCGALRNNRPKNPLVWAENSYARV